MKKIANAALVLWFVWLLLMWGWVHGMSHSEGMHGWSALPYGVMGALGLWIAAYWIAPALDTISIIIATVYVACSSMLYVGIGLHVVRSMRLRSQQ